MGNDEGDELKPAPAVVTGAVSNSGTTRGLLLADADSRWIIDRDDNHLYGWIKTDRMIEISLTHLRASLLYAGSSLYREACKARLVHELEANPIEFLRRENFHPWAAARRLLTYWEERARLFGVKTAFLPLSQSRLLPKGSALSDENVDLLRSDAVLLTGDEQAVLIFDEAKLDVFEVQDPQYALRCLWYLLSVAAEVPHSYTKGVDVLIALNGSGRDEDRSSNYRILSETILQCVHLIFRALPIKLGSLHLVDNCNGESKTRGPISSSSVVELRDGTKLDCTVHRACVCSVNDVESLLQRLSSLEISREVLPERLGGLGKHSSWHLDRAEYETERYTHFNRSTRLDLFFDTTNVTPKLEFELKQPPPSSDSSSNKKQKSVLADLKDADPDRLDFIRKRNALYSRRKYHRKKIEVEVLRNQSTELNRQKHDLMRESERLERLLAAAKTQVAIYEASSIRHAEEATPFGFVLPGEHLMTTNQLGINSFAPGRPIEATGTVLTSSQVEPWAGGLPGNLNARFRHTEIGKEIAPGMPSSTYQMPSHQQQQIDGYGQRNHSLIGSAADMQGRLINSLRIQQGRAPNDQLKRSQEPL